MKYKIKRDRVSALKRILQKNGEYNDLTHFTNLVSLYDFLNFSVKYLKLSKEQILDIVDLIFDSK